MARLIDAAAIVLTSADRAKDGPKPPAYITALGSGGFNWKNRPPEEWQNDTARNLSRTLWASTYMTPKDIDGCELYDGFSPDIYWWLEAMAIQAADQLKAVGVNATPRRVTASDIRVLVEELWLAGAEAIASADHVAASSSSAPGTTSETRPIWNARCADSRSWLPSSDMRMTSLNGIAPDMWIGS